MKFIQKIMALGLVICLSINIATAQRGNKVQDPEAYAQKQTDRLTKQLSLTDVQVREINAINLEYARKMEAAKADKSIDKKNAKVTRKRMKDERSSAIKTVLNDDQLVKFEEFRNEKMKKKAEKGQFKDKRKRITKKGQTPEQRAQRNTDRLVKRLSLTEAQSTEVSKVYLDYNQRIEEMRNGATPATKEAKEALKKDKETAIKSILTPEQLELFEARKDRKSEGRKMKKKAKRG